MIRTLILGVSALVAWSAGTVNAAGNPEPPAAHPAIIVAPIGHADDGYGSAAGDRHLAQQQAAQAASARPPSIQDVIRSAFAPLGGGAVDWAEQIAYCESKYDPNAVNQASDAQGLFQFLPSTWAGTPFAGASPFDASANAKAAAWLFQTYGPSQWECQA